MQAPGGNIDLAIFTQTYAQGVVALSGSASVTLDLHGLGSFSVVTDASSSVTVSRVDSPSASAHISGARQFTVTANSLQVTPVDWPFVYVSVSGSGTATVAAI